MWRVGLLLLAGLSVQAQRQSRDELLEPWFRGDLAGLQRALSLAARHPQGRELYLRCATELEIERGSFAAAGELLARTLEAAFGRDQVVYTRLEARLHSAAGDLRTAERVALRGQEWDGPDLKRLRLFDPLSLNVLGEVHYVRGRYDTALAIWGRSLEEAHKNRPAEWVEAKVLEAVARLALGDKPAARKAAEEALQVSLKKFGDLGPRTLDAKDTLGAVLVAQGLYAEADPLIAGALAARQDLFDHPHAKISASYLHAAQLLAGRKDFPKALEFATEAVRQIRAALPAANARTALVLAEAAGIDIAAGKPDDAREKLRAAGQLLALHLGEKVPSVQAISQKLAALPASRP